MACVVDDNEANSQYYISTSHAKAALHMTVRCSSTLLARYTPADVFLRQATDVLLSWPKSFTRPFNRSTPQVQQPRIYERQMRVSKDPTVDGFAKTGNPSVEVRPLAHICVMLNFQIAPAR